jgi:hypothetical protein
MIEVKCQNCKQPFMARTADRKRGWGKFCGKSCKAIRQEARTGQMSEYLDRKFGARAGGNFIFGAAEDGK